VKLQHVSITITTTIAIILLGVSAMAQVSPTVPGAADSARIRPDLELPPRSSIAPQLTQEDAVSAATAPPGAEQIRFTLQSVVFDGVAQFDPRSDFKDLLGPLLGQEINLAQIYELTAQITNFYRSAGFLLSYAYVPAQRIADGEITLAVVEGYIADVQVEGEDPNSRLTRAYAQRIIKQRPLHERNLESTLLRLNDLPGYGYRAILARQPGAPAGESTLTLIPQRKSLGWSAAIDNFSSRYLGPQELSATFSGSILAQQQTAIIGLSSLPLSRLNYGLINHAWAFAPDWEIDATLSLTRSKPGYSLRALDLVSETTGISVGLRNQLIRQRDHNLVARLSLEMRDTISNIAGSTPLTRDNVRVTRASLNYDNLSWMGGISSLNLTLSQGIDGINASPAGATRLSRAQAEPDFRKLELSGSHRHRLTDSLGIQLQVAGQMADGPLYASEEFGVGGQIFGRAYDASEIVGDSGAAASLELLYSGLRTMQPINLEPFFYIDGGVVYNRDSGQSQRDSLASAGLGLRFAAKSGTSGVVSVAIPITREVNAPLYGLSSSGPRLLFKLSHQF
jgi:hemolysin activation/secretion protein